MNGITERQLRPAMLDIIRARTLVYRRAKCCQAIVLTLNLALPVAAALSTLLLPAARPVIALLAIVFGFFEVTTIDSWMRSRLKIGARLQEEFDCEVLDLAWNDFVSGGKVDAEDIFDSGHRKLCAADEMRLRDWYPTAVASAPIAVARLICQRENLVYDSSLRVAYRRFLFWSVVSFVAVASAISLYANPTFTSLVFYVLVPAAPALTWAFRENKRQADTLETLNRLKTETEKLLKQAIGGIDQDEARRRSRELQDAIFNHRVASSLVFEWLYGILRSRLESKLVRGAEHWVKEARKATP